MARSGSNSHSKLQGSLEIWEQDCLTWFNKSWCPTWGWALLPGKNRRMGMMWGAGLPQSPSSKGDSAWSRISIWPSKILSIIIYIWILFLYKDWQAYLISLDTFRGAGKGYTPSFSGEKTSFAWRGKMGRTQLQGGRVHGVWEPFLGLHSLASLEGLHPFWDQETWFLVPALLLVTCMT